MLLKIERLCWLEEDVLCCTRKIWSLGATGFSFHCCTLQADSKKSSGDYLPPVDHSLVEYEDFAKV